MFYRFLGKYFLFFFVIPSIVRSVRFAAPIAADILNKSMKDIMKEEESKNGQDRRNTPPSYREYLDRQKQQ